MPSPGRPSEAQLRPSWFLPSHPAAQLGWMIGAEIGAMILKWFFPAHTRRTSLPPAPLGWTIGTEIGEMTLKRFFPTRMSESREGISKPKNSQERDDGKSY